MHRREFLVASSFGIAGMAGRCAEAANSLGRGPSFGQARSTIFIYLTGGPSHIDLWDMKPEAPAEVRGCTTIKRTKNVVVWVARGRYALEELLVPQSAYPADKPVGPEHIAHTIYHAMGIDDMMAKDNQDRPFHVLEEGEPLISLFGT